MWREPKGSPFRKLKLLGRHTIKSNLLKVRDNDYSISDFYDVLEQSKFIDNILAKLVTMSRPLILDSSMTFPVFSSTISTRVRRGSVLCSLSWHVESEYPIKPASVL